MWKVSETSDDAIFASRIESGRLDVVEYIVALGVNCRSDNNGKTNLMQSARAGNAVITNYLLAHARELSLDMNAVDSNDENALFYAVRSRSTSIVIALLGKLCLYPLYHCITGCILLIVIHTAFYVWFLLPSFH